MIRLDYSIKKTVAIEKRKKKNKFQRVENIQFKYCTDINDRFYFLFHYQSKNESI